MTILCSPGPTKRLTEFENEMKSVYPIKAKIISFGSSKSIKTLNRRLHWGEEGIVYQHDPRHIDVLVKELWLEKRQHCADTSSTKRSRRRKVRAAESDSAPRVQITGGQMFVPQFKIE